MGPPWDFTAKQQAPLTAAGEGESDTEIFPTGIWTIEKAQDEWSQQRVPAMHIISEPRVSPTLTAAYFLSLFRLRRGYVMIPG